MKKTTLLYALLFSFVLLPGSACAENSWWNKGADILKTLSNEPATQTVAKLSYADISKAFKQALSIGAENVVNQVGTLDGFNADPSIHIPLPKELNTIKTVLSKVGMSQMVDDLELKLNRAAEAAAPKAKNLFLQAIAAMTFDDVQNIYKGPEDSATKYFQSKMTPSLDKYKTNPNASTAVSIEQAQPKDSSKISYPHPITTHNPCPSYFHMLEEHRCDCIRNHGKVLE